MDQPPTFRDKTFRTDGALSQKNTLVFNFKFKRFI